MPTPVPQLGVLLVSYSRLSIDEHIDGDSTHAGSSRTLLLLPLALLTFFVHGGLGPNRYQAGVVSIPGLVVIRVSPVPLAFMAYSSALPSRVLENTIRAPSGDQAGGGSMPGLVVSRASPVPSAFMAYSSALPSRVLENTMRAPSGDQAGVVSPPGLVVSRASPVPSAFMAYSSAFPSRVLEKAIRSRRGRLKVAAYTFVSKPSCEV